MGPVIGGSLALVLLLGIAWCSRAAWRMRVQWAVTRDRERMIEGREVSLRQRNDTANLTGKFGRESLITAEQFLGDAALLQLKQEASENAPRLVRSYVPAHKQGGTVSYETIHAHAPHCLA